MKRSLKVVFGLIILVAVASAFTKIKNPEYKNLQILPQDITEKQMDSVMHHFTESLNVKCNFCHVKQESNEREWDYASDKNKHKLVARQMMTMTNELNKKYFDQTGAAITLSSKLAVSCYTCHHGATDPTVKVPKPENGK